jgi:hypothetical protein
VSSAPFRHIERLTIPARQETAAVTLGAPKTAALCFDRVWGALDPGMPSSIGFWAKTPPEERLLSWLAKQLEGQEGPAKHLRDHPDHELSIRLSSPTSTLVEDPVVTLSRGIAQAITAKLAMSIVPVFDSRADRDAEFKAGDRAAIVAILQDVPVPVERELDWQQIEHFRNDREMCAAFRRFSHWLDKEMAGKSQSFIADELSIRLEHYREALRKHGIATALGVLSTTLDSKVLLGGSATVASLSYAGEPSWALAAGAAIVVGRAAVSIAQALLDIRIARKETSPEVAFVAEVARRGVAN